MAAVLLYNLHEAKVHDLMTVVGVLLWSSIDVVGEGTEAMVGILCADRSRGPDIYHILIFAHNKITAYFVWGVIFHPGFEQFIT